MRRLTLLEVFLLWVVGFGGMSIAARQRVAAFVKRFRLPPMISYYLLATPIILLEEALTIEVPYFWGILPMVAAFYIMLLPLYLIQRHTGCSFVMASLLFGAWGCYNEFIFVGRIHQMDGFVLVILVVLCFLIYAVMAILPTYYLQVVAEARSAGGR